jgi:hypothetical protein
MGESLTPEERIAKLEQQLLEARKEIADLTASLNTDLDMFEDDERWEEQALELLEQTVRAMRRTSQVLASKELSITEADMLRQNEELLAQARAFLAQHKERDVE